MLNRTRFFPIFLGATLSMGVASIRSQAEPGVPNDGSNPAPAVVAPPPTANEATPAPTAPAPVTAPAPAATMAPATPSAGPAPIDPNATTYTVVSGDSLWLIAQKLGCSVSALKKANNLKKNALKPGQVLKVPHAKSKTAEPTTTPTPKPSASATPHKKQTHPSSYVRAQPVQDFDIPASTFASCPVPDPATVPDAKPASDSSTASDATETHARVAKLVSPDEMEADTATQVAPTPAPKPVLVPVAPVVAIAKPSHAPAPAVEPTPAPNPVQSAPAATSNFSSSSSKQGGRSSFFSSSSSSSASSMLSSNWANRFMQEAKQLSDLGLEYDESWRPPGEAHAWAMDCSNTSRYLYKVTANIDLPRTASDQYYYLHLQNKAWDVPQASNGYADLSYLRDNLKPGDLLFWENTYRPERQPPITHVMVYLGTDEKGQWLMVGSQSSRGGFHNRRGGGPDIYVFDPLKPSGGYTTWLGLVRHKGRFCAYGRPLEADPTKLSVAAN